MQRLLLFLALLVSAATLPAQAVVLEDFEGGVADLNWMAFDGTYDGPVLNQADSLRNTSEWAGSYTKGAPAFSTFLADFDAPLDLSVNNRFSIQINAGAATSLLMKLEGGGQSIERRVNITVPNFWRTYTFDFFDAREMTGLNRIVLFFDAGTEDSMDTYLFDNLIALPADDCSGTVEDVTIIDDFECQRNAAYGGGFDELEVIDNPVPGGINQSTGVGEYTDQPGEFAGLVIDYDGGLDLSVNNFICIDVYAPVAGNLLVKLQGGISMPFEVGNQVETTNEWVQVCVDFSSQAAADHDELVFFFNAGENGEGDIYYIDNITRTPAPVQAALEDFEDGANLSWGPANNNPTVNGTYNGVVANPMMGEGNMSPNVGSYTRAGTNFSTLSAELQEGLDLSANPQMNLDVLLPAGSSAVTLQLVSALEGPRSISVTGVEAGSWQTVNFNFEEFAEVDDFFQVNILFDPNTMMTGTYFYDNLAQGITTVDACVEVPTDEDVLDDFECQRNANYTCCDVTVMPANNPQITPANTSLRVGEVMDPPGGFNALVIDNGEAFDLSLKNQLSMKILAPVAGQILFKLEGGPNAALEIFQDIPAVGEWTTMTVDLSGAAGQGYTRLALFFGAGTDNATANIYYIDDVELNRAPFSMDCVTTFEGDDITLENWMYFANGSLEAEPFVIESNPLVSDGNQSESVGSFLKASDGETFAGITSVPIAPIVISDVKTATIKILMPVAGNVVLKLEAPRGEALPSGDLVAEYTTPNEWQTLTFDLSSTQGGMPIEAGFAYDRLTLIPNIGVIPDATQMIFFDDIAVGGAMCGTTSLFNPAPRLADLRVFPNPVGERLTIENADDATDFAVHNLLGQQLRTLRSERGSPRLDMDMSDLPRGTYVLTARNRSGQLVARTKFVKE